MTFSAHREQSRVDNLHPTSWTNILDRFATCYSKTEQPTHQFSRPSESKGPENYFYSRMEDFTKRGGRRSSLFCKSLSFRFNSSRYVFQHSSKLKWAELSWASKKTWNHNRLFQCVLNLGRIGSDRVKQVANQIRNKRLEWWLCDSNVPISRLCVRWLFMRTLGRWFCQLCFSTVEGASQLFVGHFIWNLLLFRRINKLNKSSESPPIESFRLWSTTTVTTTRKRL